MSNITIEIDLEDGRVINSKKQVSEKMRLSKKIDAFKAFGLAYCYPKIQFDKNCLEYGKCYLFRTYLDTLEEIEKIIQNESHFIHISGYPIAYIEMQSECFALYSSEILIKDRCLLNNYIYDSTEFLDSLFSIKYNIEKLALEG